jgi:hypothetical protein
MTRWYSEFGPWHQNSDRAGLIKLWDGTDTEELYLKNLKNSTSKAELEQYGWVDYPITYRYNFQGFRSDEFDDRECGLALGCSHTLGIGLPTEMTWPHVLSKLSKLHFWNLGVSNCSIDTCFRMLDHYITVLSPKYICMLRPPRWRFEIVDSNHTFNVVRVTDRHHVDEFKTWFTHDINSELHHRKVLLAMERICDVHNIPFFHYDCLDPVAFLPTPVGGAARDLQHFGLAAHTNLSNLFLKNITKI